MQQDLLSHNPLRRLRQLVPAPFFLRALLLLALGGGCMAVVFLHLAALPAATTALRLWFWYAVVLLLGNGYLLLVYPVRESFAFPQGRSHPILFTLVALAYGVEFFLLRTGLAAGANPWLMAFTAFLPACTASGLAWAPALGLVVVGSLVLKLALAAYTGLDFFVLVLLAQLVVLILFKALIEEFHQRTLLNLSLAELQATRHLLEQSVAQSTRQQVARDLHDELGHLVTRLHLNLQHYLTQQSTADPLLKETAGLLQELQQQVRNIALQLRQNPTFDLKGTLQALAQAIAKPRITLHLNELEDDCPAAIGEVLFRISQEAITNCLRHSNATHINLRIQHTDGRYQLEIEDNGTLGTQPAAGSGLAGLRERVTALNGELNFHAGANGFLIQATLPESQNAPLPAAD